MTCPSHTAVKEDHFSRFSNGRNDPPRSGTRPEVGYRPEDPERPWDTTAVVAGHADHVPHRGVASPHVCALSSCSARWFLRPPCEEPMPLQGKACGSLRSQGEASARRTSLRSLDRQARCRGRSPQHPQRPHGYSRRTTIAGPRRSAPGGRSWSPYFRAWGALSSVAAKESVVCAKNVAYR